MILEDGSVNLENFLINKVPPYLKEDFPQAGSSGRGCETLIRRVGDEARNNILHPGYSVEQLDDQIKKIYKNITIKQRVLKTRKRNNMRDKHMRVKSDGNDQFIQM